MSEKILPVLYLHKEEVMQQSYSLLGRLDMRNHGHSYAFTGVETMPNLPDRSSFSFCKFCSYLAHGQVFALKIPGIN